MAHLIGDKDWSKYVAREASLLLQQLNPTDTYNAKLALELAHLREETRALRGASANFEWRVEQTAPARPATSASARAARTMGTPPAHARRAPHSQWPTSHTDDASRSGRPTHGGAPASASSEPPDAAARVDGTASRARRAAPSSARPSVASSAASSRSDAPLARAASHGTLADARLRSSSADVAARARGTWTAGDEPRGAFYASRPYTETRAPAPGDDDCDVDALRKRAADFGGLGAAAREADALDRAAREAARSKRGFRPPAADAPGLTLLAQQSLASASLGRLGRTLHPRPAARTAGAVRGERARAAAHGAGVWEGVAGSLSTGGLASGLHSAEAARPRALAPEPSRSAAALASRNLSHRQVKWEDFDWTAPRLAPGFAGATLGALGARSEALRAAETAAAAASASASAARKAASAAARANGDAPLGAAARVPCTPQPAVAISVALALERRRAALAAAEAAQLLADAQPPPRRGASAASDDGRGGREKRRSSAGSRARRSAKSDDAATPALMANATLTLERMRLGWPIGEA